MKTFFWLSCALIGISLNTGCSAAMEDLGLFKNTELPTPELFSVKFADQPVNFEVVKATSLKVCLQCHTGGDNDLSSPDQLLAQKDKVMAQLQRQTMPPKASGLKPLTSCEKNILETWLDDQSKGRSLGIKVKDVAGCSGVEKPIEAPPVVLADLEATFENLKKEILGPKCLACHDSYNYEGTILETLDDIKSGGYIGATVEESVLYKRVTHTTEKRFMPPPKSGIPALTPDELTFLRRWLEANIN